MSLTRQKLSPLREKRIGAVSAWSGSLDAFVREAATGEIEQRIRTYAQDTPNDVEYALELLRTLDVAIVVHGPAGCAAGLQRSVGGRLPWLVTNLNERDSIMGSDVKLRKAIQEAHKAYGAKAIAVVTTPVVAINNDDVDSVTEELKDELSIPVVAVYVDGFRSKVGSSGLDAVIHALVKHLLPVRRRGEGAHVNLLSVSENRSDVDHLRGLLTEIGIESVLFPRFADVQDAAQVVAAKLSVAIDPDAADYAGKVLEGNYGIPFLRTPAPVGVQATAKWLGILGKELGLESKVDALVGRESLRLSKLVQGASVSGSKVFLNLPASQVFAFRALAKELGLEVVGIKTPWIAAHHAALAVEAVQETPELPILAGDGQPFEEVNLLGRIRPDLYITSGAPAIHVLRLGIPVLDLSDLPLLGFAGMEQVVRGIERTLSNTALSRFLAEGADEPYDPSWLKKSVHWYIKQEVK